MDKMVTDRPEDDAIEAVQQDMEPRTSLHKAAVDAAIATIKTATIENLSDPAWLENELLLTLGLNDENLWEFPEQLYPFCGKGIKSWQYPSQFAKYLNFLRQQRISNYLEIGCRHGGTFIITVEFLNRFHPIQNATAVDPFFSESMEYYKSLNPCVTYLNDYSTNPATINTLQSRSWDLALIDGDHTFEGAMHDYLIVRDYARIFAFHDIVNSACPGVVRIWQMLRCTTPSSFLREFVAQYDEVEQRTGRSFLGLGLMLKSDPSQIRDIVSFLNG